MRKIMLVMAAVLALGACSIPQTKIYTLSLFFEKEAVSSRSGLPLNVVVQSPRYLGQPYIACRTSPFQIEIAKYAKWDASPVEIVRESMKDSFSGIFREVRTGNVMGEGSYAIEVYLRRFERTDSGSDSSADITFDVSLFSPEGKGLFRRTVSKTAKLDDMSYVTLARALSFALTEAVTETKAEVVKIVTVN
ncbi:MAG: membrane integrity-associated transporter subunit PqiC [Nitrospirae bacterium]|nr:membrane integrity-associated transporter subunit PqiC [Nitrospirota bacterium]